MKGKYPERTKYFAFKKSDKVRYFKFKTKCPNCGKVCVEDFLADKVERIKMSPLINCHRCGRESKSSLIWRKVVQ